MITQVDYKQIKDLKTLVKLKETRQFHIRLLK